MRNFTKAENDRVDFLVEELAQYNKVGNNISIWLAIEYQNELMEYVMQNHPRAADFYYYGEWI